MARWNLPRILRPARPASNRLGLPQEPLLLRGIGVGESQAEEVSEASRSLEGAEAHQGVRYGCEAMATEVVAGRPVKIAPSVADWPSKSPLAEPQSPREGNFPWSRPGEDVNLGGAEGRGVRRLMVAWRAGLERTATPAGTLPEGASPLALSYAGRVRAGGRCLGR